MNFSYECNREVLTKIWKKNIYIYKALILFGNIRDMLIQTPRNIRLIILQKEVFKIVYSWFHDFKFSIFSVAQLSKKKKKKKKKKNLQSFRSANFDTPKKSCFDHDSDINRD